MKYYLLRGESAPEVIGVKNGIMQVEIQREGFQDNGMYDQILDFFNAFKYWNKMESLVPSLKISQQCTFDKKFLVVKGKLLTYKIHMGSGNILMEPDDQYLCIVPASAKSSKEKVFLPFEGDGLLSIIQCLEPWKY